MSLLQSLSIKRKITAIFAHGTSRMNLGILATVELLNGTPDCPVEVDANVPDASNLLRDLAAQANRKITAAPNGLVLTLPVVEQVAVEPVNQPIPRTRRGDVPASKEPKAERRYRTLSSIFFFGSVQGHTGLMSRWTLAFARPPAYYRRCGARSENFRLAAIATKTASSANSVLGLP